MRILLWSLMLALSSFFSVQLHAQTCPTSNVYCQQCTPAQMAAICGQFKSCMSLNNNPTWVAFCTGQATSDCQDQCCGGSGPKLKKHK